MKIHVESTEKNIHLSVPNQLIFNRLSASMIAKQIKLEDTFNLDKQTMKKMMKLLRKMTKKYKGLCIVEVCSAKGEKVEIKW